MRWPFAVTKTRRNAAAWVVSSMFVIMSKAPYVPRTDLASARLTRPLSDQPAKPTSHCRRVERQG